MFETNSKIGHACIIDNGVIIAHDNLIGDDYHIAEMLNWAVVLKLEIIQLLVLLLISNNGVEIGKNCYNLCWFIN